MSILQRVVSASAGTVGVSGVEGDFVLLMAGSRNGTAMTTPAGYTLIDTVQNSGAIGLAFFYRFLVAGDTTNMPAVTGASAVSAMSFSGVSPSATFIVNKAAASNSLGSWAHGQTNPTLVVAGLAGNVATPNTLTGTGFVNPGSKTATSYAHTWGYFGDNSSTYLAEQSSPAAALTGSSSALNSVIMEVAITNPTNYVPLPYLRGGIDAQTSTVALPANNTAPYNVRPGDLVFVYAEGAVGSTSADALAGWTLAGQSTAAGGGTGGAAAIWWKYWTFADYNAGAAFTWNGGTYGVGSSALVIVANPAASTPLSLGSWNQISSTALVVPSVTGKKDNLVITLASDNGGNSGYAATYGTRVTFSPDAGKAAAPENAAWVTRLTSSGASGNNTISQATTLNMRGLNVLIALPNRAPNTPTVTSPNGGEQVDASNVTILWTDNGDPDGDTLTFDLDYSSNAGTSWASITTGVSGTSYAWNATGVTSSPNSLVRVRAKDPGGLYSGYDASNAVWNLFSTVLMGSVTAQAISTASMNAFQAAARAVASAAGFLTVVGSAIAGAISNAFNNGSVSTASGTGMATAQSRTLVGTQTVSFYTDTDTASQPWTNIPTQESMWGAR